MSGNKGIRFPNSKEEYIAMSNSLAQAEIDYEMYMNEYKSVTSKKQENDNEDTKE